VIRTLFPALAALLAVGCAAEAQEGAAEPKPALELTGRVVDAASILSPDFEQRLTARLAELEKDTLVQLVVATTPDLEGRKIDAYAFELGNSRGLGDQERDDGLLLLVASNERRVRIEVGRGLEASVRDQDATAIIQNAILPHFRSGDFESGIDAGIEGLVREVTPVPMKEAA
jgi:uncharacterized protein